MTMTIVQISDLHFGAHNEALAEALVRRMQKLRPDMIVASGDLVDDPRQELFAKAKKYLEELETCCAPPPAEDAERPRLLCIPGNHDIVRGGFLLRPLRRITYADVFSKFHQSYFFLPERVWIFGFDSAQTALVGGAGKVGRAELQRFHAEYARLDAKHGTVFGGAFKIAVVHHHPLPVDWAPTWRQRFLTMTDSGAFLAGVLHKKIDLVLHGHEHLQARARLRSTLGGTGETEIAVVGLGATLAVHAKGRNWFNVFSVAAEGDVTVTSYPAFDQDFEETGEKATIRSRQPARDAAFDSGKLAKGFWYREVISTSILDKDGDARRTVDYNGLQILDASSERASKHEIEMSYTSGYIDMPEVTTAEDCNLAGIYFLEPPPDKAEPQRALKRTISWADRVLHIGEDVSYKCSWFAVNGFAMNQRQFASKYSDRTGLEFTHLPVHDPIQELMIVVQYPPGFRLKARPEIRVSKHDSKVDARHWVRNNAVEHELRQSRALRYVETIRVASLRVERPLPGYSYAIQWRVPECASRQEGMEAARIRDILALLLRSDGTEIIHQRSIAKTLEQVLSIAYQIFKLDSWSKGLESTFMIFNEVDRKLRTVGSLVMNLDEAGVTVQHPEQPISSNSHFDYGDGIAGRAFKANENRFFVKPVETRKEPDYYRHIQGKTPHEVLLSMPVRNPKDPEYIYGVLNIASMDASCPLRSFAPGNEETKMAKTRDTIACFQSNVDVLFYDELSSRIPC
jgi:3',5'-cyclic AMP phosphodiesterase CpdA